jgi:hypothetical protein
MSLTGLTPEQITALGNLGQGQQDLMIRAATALAQKQESAANREAQFRTIGISLDGKDYDIDARDFPNMWAKIQETNRANDTELFTMYDGQKVRVPRDQMSNFINAQANMLQLPSQIASQSATARRSIVEAEDTEATRQSRINQARRLAAYYAGNAENAMTQSEAQQRQFNAIDALRAGGASGANILEPKYFADALEASPGTTAAALNMSGRGDGGMRDSDYRQIMNQTTNLGWQIMDAGKDASDVDITSFNQQASKIGLGYMIARDPKGRPAQLRMPRLNDNIVPPELLDKIFQNKGYTLDQAIQRAYERGVDPAAFFQLIVDESYREATAGAPQIPQAPVSP